MSLVLTLLLYSILGANPKFNILGSLSIGFIEETGKLLVGCYFALKSRLTHVFNGMLIGDAVGTGFAALVLVNGNRQFEFSNIMNISFFAFSFVQLFYMQCGMVSFICSYPYWITRG